MALLALSANCQKTDSSDNYLQLEEQLSGLRIYAKSIQDCYGPVLNLIDETIVTNKQSRISSIELVNMICDYLENNYSKPLTLETISQLFNYSASYISASFKKHKACSPMKYLTTIRINQSISLMTMYPEMPSKKIAEMVGYTDSHYFSRIFKNVTGKSPSNYRDAL